MTSCRFCGAIVQISLPPGEYAARLARMSANRGCCERCKQYHGERTHRVDTIASIAVSFGRTKAGDERETLRGALGTIVGKLVGSAAVHHARSLGDSTGELLEAIYADPFRARQLCEMFEEGCK